MDVLTPEKLFYISTILEDTQNRISKYAINKRTVLELSVIRMCDPSLSDNAKALSARIAELEKKINVISVMGCDVPQRPENTAVETRTDVAVDNPDEPAASERIPFTNTGELYDFLSQKPSACAFLKQTDIYINGGKIEIEADRFAIDMIGMECDNDLLNAAFSTAMGKKTSVYFTEVDKTNDKNQQSLIDEL